MDIALVAIQVASAIVLGLIGILESTRSDGKLNRRGRLALVIAAVFNLSATVGKAGADRATAQRQERLIEDLRTRMAELISLISHNMLPKPQGPVQSTPFITLQEPKAGDRVQPRQLIRGRVEEPDARVWVIIHPVNTGAYWVQAPASVRDDGTWTAFTYFGGSNDKGIRFEVMAVAYAPQQLTEAEILTGWPEARWRSNIITVIRA